MEVKPPAPPPPISRHIHIRAREDETAPLCGLPLGLQEIPVRLASSPTWSNCPECIAKCPEKFRHLEAQDGKTECGHTIDHARVRLALLPNQQQDVCPNCVEAVSHRLKQTVEAAATEAKTEAVTKLGARLSDALGAQLTESMIAAAENAGRISPAFAYEARRLLANEPTIAKIEAQVAELKPPKHTQEEVNEAVDRLFAKVRITESKESSREQFHRLMTENLRPILLPVDPERMSRDYIKNMHQKLGEGLAREVKLKEECERLRNAATETEKQNEITYRWWCDEARGAREDAEHFKTELADAKKLIAAQSNMYDALAAKSAALEAEKQAAVKAVCDQCDAEVKELRAQLAGEVEEKGLALFERDEAANGRNEALRVWNECDLEVRELRERLKVHAAHRDDAERRATAALDALAQAQATIRDMSLARTRLEAEGAARRKLRERAKGREWWTMVDLVPGEIDVMSCVEHDDNLRGIPRAIVAAVVSATLVAVQDYMTVSSEELETLLRGTRAWAEEENGLDLEVYTQPAHFGVILRLAAKDKVVP